MTFCVRCLASTSLVEGKQTREGGMVFRRSKVLCFSVAQGNKAFSFAYGFREPGIGSLPQLEGRGFSEKFGRASGKGITILLVEHSAQLALRLVDRAWATEIGPIILEGAAESEEVNCTQAA